MQGPADFRGTWRDDDDARAVYAEAAGIGRVIPRAVAVPADVDDVVRLVQWAAEHRASLIPRGSGSSMAGGAIGDGVIVDLSRLRERTAIDRKTARAHVQPGVLRGEIDADARAVGLRLPVDPSSGAFATIGGMCATNAAGAHTLRFGPMRRWVRALDVVLSDGTLARLERGAPVPAIPILERFERELIPTLATVSADAIRGPAVAKNSSGYDLGAGHPELVDLMIGSEGTLAIIVGIELVLAPAPARTASLLAAYSSLDDAVNGAIAARQAGAAACELLDRTFIDVARRGGLASNVPPGSEAVLLAEVEGDSDALVEGSATVLARAFREAGAADVQVALTTDDEHRLWELRHAASPILSKLDPALKSMQFIEDGAVPPERLAAYVRGVREALEAHDVPGVIFGHAGDAHVHVNPLVDVRQRDWRSRVEGLFADVRALTARLEGTMSGEHGDGRLRAPAIDATWSLEAIETFRRVKDVFDPLGILNPGVKLPLAGQRPIEDIKYDPSLPPLAPLARAALDVVADTRAYHRFRLDLLDEARASLAPPATGEAKSDHLD